MGLLQNKINAGNERNVNWRLLSSEEGCRWMSLPWREKALWWQAWVVDRRNKVPVVQPSRPMERATSR